MAAAKKKRKPPGYCVGALITDSGRVVITAATRRGKTYKLPSLSRDDIHGLMICLSNLAEPG